MEDDKKFWRNKTESFGASEVYELTQILNRFYKDRFVIATQVFPPKLTATKNWVAIVYYKISPEAQAKEQENIDDANAAAADEEFRDEA